MGPSRSDLGKYLSTVQKKCFVLGEHDCLIFTNACWHAMYNEGWADDWLARYHHNGVLRKRVELRKEYSAESVVQAIDARLVRCSSIPPFGSLVSIKSSSIYVGIALGISLGDQAVFVGIKSLEYMSIVDIEHAWVQK